MSEYRVLRFFAVSRSASSFVLFRSNDSNHTHSTQNKTDQLNLRPKVMHF